MTHTKRLGRPPANPIEGAARNFTIRLTPAQVARALQHGATINQGINALLRKNDNPDLLAALVALLKVCDEELDPKRTPEMRDARIAIVRATGAA